MTLSARSDNAEYLLSTQIPFYYQPARKKNLPPAPRGGRGEFWQWSGHFAVVSNHIAYARRESVFGSRRSSNIAFCSCGERGALSTGSEVREGEAVDADCTVGFFAMQVLYQRVALSASGTTRNLLQENSGIRHGTVFSCKGTHGGLGSSKPIPPVFFTFI